MILALRRYSLRKCLERFAPYGHRATWDHLCSRAGFGPEDRSPSSSAARGRTGRVGGGPLRLARLRGRVRRAPQEGEARRAAPAGQRGRPAPAHLGRIRRRAVRRPADPPPRITGRGAAPVIAALEREPGTVCPVCTGERLTWMYDLAHEPSSVPLHGMRNRRTAARPHARGARGGQARAVARLRVSAPPGRTGRAAGVAGRSEARGRPGYGGCG